MSETQTTTGPPAVADPQDPLPESNWVWRRWYVFAFAAVTMICVAAVLWIIWELGRSTLNLIGLLGALRDVQALNGAVDVIGQSIDELAGLGFYLIMLTLAMHILYLIAPSAEQAAKMMATVSAWKGGVSTASTARATAPDGSVAEASKTAGQATAAPVIVPPMVPAAPPPENAPWA